MEWLQVSKADFSTCTESSGATDTEHPQTSTGNDEAETYSTSATKDGRSGEFMVNGLADPDRTFVGNGKKAIEEGNRGKTSPRLLCI